MEPPRLPTWESCWIGIDGRNALSHDAVRVNATGNVGQRKMKLLYDEICRRFPEVHTVSFDDCADLPYSLMSMLADWLKAAPAISPEVIQRVQAFTS